MPSTALGGPGSSGGCENLCAVLGLLCQHWQQGTPPARSCHHLPDSSCRQQSTAHPVLSQQAGLALLHTQEMWNRGRWKSAWLFSISGCEESQCLRSSAPRFPHTEQLCRELSLEQCRTPPRQCCLLSHMHYECFLCLHSFRAVWYLIRGVLYSS